MDGREPPTSGSLALPHRQRFRLVSARRALVGLGGVPDVRARGLLGTQAYDPVFACTAFKLFLTRRSSPATSVASASGRGGPSGGPARCRVPVMSLIYGVDLLTTLHSRRDCEMCYVFFKRTATNHHSQRCGRGVARLVGAVGPSLRQLRNMRRTRNFFTLDSQVVRKSHLSYYHRACAQARRRIPSAHLSPRRLPHAAQSSAQSLLPSRWDARSRRPCTVFTAAPCPKPCLLAAATAPAPPALLTCMPTWVRSTRRSPTSRRPSRAHAV